MWPVILERGNSGEKREWGEMRVSIEGDFDNCFDVFFKIGIRSLKACG